MKIGFATGLRDLYRHMSKARRRQLRTLMWLMLLGALADLATIGAVIPFLILLADPAPAQSLGWAEQIFEATGASTAAQRGTVAALAFGALAIIAGLVRLRGLGVEQKHVRDLLEFAHALEIGCGTQADHIVGHVLYAR